MYTYSTCVPVGNSNVRIEFTDGTVTTAGVTPATYITSNIAVQRAIETSRLFKSGKVKLVSSFYVGKTKEYSAKTGDATPKEPAAAVDEADLTANMTGTEPDETDLAANMTGTEAEDETPADNAEAGKTYPDVKNTQQAKAVLESEFGVGLDEMQSKADVKAKAAEVGAIFPNWK